MSEEKPRKEYWQTIIWNGREMVVPMPFDINAALVVEKQQVEQRLAEARALLERAAEVMNESDIIYPPGTFDLHDEIRAFLAR